MIAHHMKMHLDTLDAETQEIYRISKIQLVVYYQFCVVIG